MSLKKKESQASGGGLRVASDDPHLVSLGGGRLSTAVTIHHLPIGDFQIGSSPSCGVVLNGSGVQPHHCTLYRNVHNEVTLVPEPEARTLIDGNKVIEETVLSQGAMLTFGKSNYLRFNNPAEAQMIRSTMGSNERISMPQIDFTQNSSSSNDGSPEEVYENLNTFLESQLSSRKKTNNNEQNKFLYDSTNIKNFHSPKVFPADSVTVNAPAKDVLGHKYNNFAKNLPQNSLNYSQNNINGKINAPKNTESFTTNHCLMENSSNRISVLTKIQNNLLLNGGQNTGQHFIQNGNQQNVNGKLQPLSACYDRYPKPGSYGSLQVFPMNGVNQQLNNEEINAESQRSRAQIERMREEEMSKMEQERLEEILKMCDEFERQNQSITSSPVVQNRIKTNGSLPRDKKGHFGDLSSSPYAEIQNSQHQNSFFPNDVTKTFKKPNSGYENVAFLHNRRVEITSDSPEHQQQHHQQQQHNSDINGYENVYPSKKYIPQSPRTKIKTCVSPTTKREAEYDLLVQSFEDKLRMEIKQLRDNKTYDVTPTTIVENGKNGYSQNIDDSDKYTENTQYDKSRVNDRLVEVKTNVKGKSKNINNLTVNIERNIDEREIGELRKQRDKALKRVRELKTQIAELQRQEDEVFRELDFEKALVSAELTTEHETLIEMERSLQRTQTKIFRLEAQRNSDRVIQETQQAKLKQSIDVKEDQVEGLEKLMDENKNDGSLRDELNTTIESLENEKKLFEDLEFQYLEEETEWLAHREELHHDLITIKKHIDERQSKIINLEKEKVENQNNACTDTKLLEKSLLSLITDLEKSRQELKSYEKQMFDISGQPLTQSDSDDEIDISTSLKNDKIMSQSLFGSNEILTIKPISTVDVMSKSVNENMFSHNIEMSVDNHFTSTPKRDQHKININQDIAKIIENDCEKLQRAEEIDCRSFSASTDSIDQSSKSSSPGTHKSSNSLFQRSNDTESDPLLKLKYNLSPETKSKSSSPSVNLNLSLESDDFEVNPLDKRVASQDDIDRISKVQLDAPISMQGASYKVKESIKEIERNRQLLLSQQGSNVIEHQRQKMNELKKRSHDEAHAQYLQLHNVKNGDESYCLKDSSLEEINSRENVEGTGVHLPLTTSSNQKTEQHLSSPQRHSHPEFDSQHRPLSEISEQSYEQTVDKQYKSTTDVSNSTNRLSENSQADDSNRNSFVSQNEINLPPTNGRLTSGTKRNVPKSQRPLTRYLPIMSSHLDLRQHVESAGHQITLCPHVHIDSGSCRGYLHKLGATFHGWSRRWFVLDRQKRALIYYSDKSERKPRGGAYFTTIDDVYLDHLNTSKSGRPHCTFIIKTKKRSYHLQASSDAAARIWIDVIITGALGNIDY